MEQEADAITHHIYDKMHRSFITPLDREDIQTLANKLDSILDLVEATALRMSLYKIKKMRPTLAEMGKTLEKAVLLVRQCVYDLKDKAKNIVANNEGDHLLRQGIAALFSEESNPIEIIKGN